MKKSIFIILVSALITQFSSDIFAETSLVSSENNDIRIFPDLADYSLHEETAEAADSNDIQINKAIWPFSGNENKIVLQWPSQEELEDDWHMVE